MKFLGLVKYLQKFIPNLSDITAPIRELTKNNVDWLWLPLHEKTIAKLKHMITTAPVLKIYDQKQPLVIQTDASQDGLGACLLQNNQPIAFASRSMTETEKRYAQIEKEMLAIKFACNKFHQYVYGRSVKVLSDHKPLQVIMTKDLNKVSARLQRIRLSLLKYDILVEYLPGKLMYVADYLSRFFLKDKTVDDPELQVIVHSLITDFPITEVKRERFKLETDKDPQCKILKGLFVKGWPENRNKVPSIVKGFWSMGHDIHIEDELLFLVQ